MVSLIQVSTVTVDYSISFCEIIAKFGNRIAAVDYVTRKSVKPVHWTRNGRRSVTKTNPNYVINF